MQDRPGDEGIQDDAAPLRSRASPREARPPGGEAQPLHAEFTISIEDAMAIHDRAMRALKAGALKPSRLPRVIGCGIGAVYVAVMFADSARIQEENHAVAGAAGRHRNPAFAGPLYTRSDAQQAHDQCVAIPHGMDRDILPDLRLRFSDAGHILGSAVVSLTFTHAGRTRRLCFTGDLGRRGLPYLRDAAPGHIPHDLRRCFELHLNLQQYGAMLPDAAISSVTERSSN